MTASLAHAHRPRLHRVGRRRPREGLLLVLTDGPEDVPAAARAAALAVSSGAPLHIAALVPGTGWSMNALLHQARDARAAAQGAAIAARVAPTLHAAGIRPATTEPLLLNPRRRGLPVARLKRVACWHRAGVLVTSAPLQWWPPTAPVDYVRPAAVDGGRR